MADENLKKQGEDIEQEPQVPIVPEGDFEKPNPERQEVAKDAQEKRVQLDRQIEKKVVGEIEQKIDAVPPTQKQQVRSAVTASVKEQGFLGNAMNGIAELIRNLAVVIQNILQRFGFAKEDKVSFVDMKKKEPEKQPMQAATTPQVTKPVSAQPSERKQRAYIEPYTYPAGVSKAEYEKGVQRIEDMIQDLPFSFASNGPFPLITDRPNERNALSMTAVPTLPEDGLTFAESSALTQELRGWNIDVQLNGDWTAITGFANGGGYTKDIPEWYLSVLRPFTNRQISRSVLEKLYSASLKAVRSHVSKNPLVQEIKKTEKFTFCHEESFNEKASFALSRTFLLHAGNVYVNADSDRTKIADIGILGVHLESQSTRLSHVVYTDDTPNFQEIVEKYVNRELNAENLNALYKELEEHDPEGIGEIDHLSGEIV